MIRIDGELFEVPIKALSDELNFLDKYAERMVNGRLRRELIGTFPKAFITFAAPTTAAERAESARLRAKLAEPVEFHSVTVPHEDAVDKTFLCYASTIRRELRRWTPTATWWHDMTVTFTAQGPEATP